MEEHDKKGAERGAAAVGATARAVPREKPPKTSGERFYDRLQFLTADAFIIVATAAIAYVARYGRNSYHGVPNYLKQFQSKVEHFFMDTLGLAKRSDFWQTVGHAAAGTTLTMWGGNICAPFLKAFDNNKEKIVTGYNEKYGKPGEVEAGHERLKDAPKQNWGDILKGRAVGWVAVFGSFLSVYQLLGKSKTPMHDAETGVSTHMHRMDQYEERVGRLIAGLTKDGKEISATPMTQALSTVQKEHKTYRFGKMIALDVFAASAALIIWNVIARYSAKERVVKHEKMESQPEQAPLTTATHDTAMAATPEHPQQTIDTRTAAIHERVKVAAETSQSVASL